MKDHCLGVVGLISEGLATSSSFFMKDYIAQGPHQQRPPLPFPVFVVLSMKEKEGSRSNYYYYYYYYYSSGTTHVDTLLPCSC